MVVSGDGVHVWLTKPHSFWKWMTKTGRDHLGKRRAGGTEMG